MATAEAISFCGARPVFVDVDEQTYTLDPAKLESAITPRVGSATLSSTYSDSRRPNLADVRADGTQSPQGITPDEQLASMLGMPRDSKPTT